MAKIDFTNVTFSVWGERLVMDAVAITTGKPYRHSCPRKDLEAVAHELDEAGAQGLDRGALHERTGLPWTRINVALLFMLERGGVQRGGPREAQYIAAVPNLHLDALTEFYALADEKPGQPAS